VQGKNVTKGDKLVIDVKTNHAVLTSTAQGRNRPERVRGVFYNANAATGPGAATSTTPASAGAAPAATTSTKP
jgi:lipopolysaccharide export system protein LptA